MSMKPADLPVPGVAYITHFTFSAFLSLICSSCGAFPKKAKPDFVVKLRAGFSHLPWIKFLLPGSGKHNDTSKLFPLAEQMQAKPGHTRGLCGNTGAGGTLRQTSSLQGTRMGSPHPARPRDNDTSIPPNAHSRGHSLVAPYQIIQKPVSPPKAGLSTAQSTGCAANGCTRPLSQSSRNKRI